MRAAFGVVLASTAIVASSVIVTLAVLPRGHVETPDIGVYRPPTPPIVYVGPAHGFAVLEPPVVACPAFDTAHGGTLHAWVDPQGQRHQLQCDTDNAIARAPGEDNELGTPDDVCTEIEVRCRFD